MTGPLRPGWARRLLAHDLTPDGELARRFHEGADQDAFELLVRRHAPAVLRVCRAVVRDPHLAEDAAQAVFLALARKAGTLAGHRSVSGWLIRVAYRAANRVRARAAAQAGAGTPAETALPAAAPGPDPADAAAAADLAAVVLAEVHRLPDRYHAPVVLCYLDGLTHAEAAARLGWPPGTVAGRLARARALLRERLARRGVTAPAGAALFAGLGASSASARFAAAAVGAALGTRPVAPMVSELTREVLSPMIPSLKQLLACAALAVGLAVGATAALTQAAGETPEPPAKGTAPVPGGPARPADEVDRKVREAWEKDDPRDKIDRIVWGHEDPPAADPRLAFDEKLAGEKKFVVVGTVTAADGKTPVEGAEVWAMAGRGTLKKTGETITDKAGQFRLVFAQGVWGKDGAVGSQGAVVRVRKPGSYAWHYGHPPQFTLSDAPLSQKDRPANTTNIVPGRPAALEFRMQPAAALRVKLVDGTGKPLANTRVWLTGEKLPPASSVIAAGETDAAGAFTAADVPRNAYRLVIEDGPGGRGTLEFGSIDFRDAAEYEAVATVHEWGAKRTHVSFKVTRGRDR